MSDTSKPGHSETTRPGASRPKVAPFARYKGTSAWRKDRRRVRAYAWFLARAGHDKQGTPASGP